MIGAFDTQNLGLLTRLTIHSVHRSFLNKLFNFIGVGLGLYIVANVYTWVSSDAVIKKTVKCRFCRKRISEKVSYLNVLLCGGIFWMEGKVMC